MFDLELGNVTPECGVIDDNKNESNKIKKREKEMEIDIKFFKINKNRFYENETKKLFGLLKLCLLKEIAITDDYDNILDIPDKIANIMSILKIGKIESKKVKEGILELLKKEKGNNIIIFSKYVDGLISQVEINKLLILKLHYSRSDILYTYNCLGKYIEYIKIFEKEFDRAKRKTYLNFLSFQQQ